jgi:hypothetical protein
MAGEEMGVQALNLLQQALWQMGGTPADQTGPESKRRRKSVTIPRTGSERVIDRTSRLSPNRPSLPAEEHQVTGRMRKFSQGPPRARSSSSSGVLAVCITKADLGFDEKPYLREDQFAGGRPRNGTLSSRGRCG